MPLHLPPRSCAAGAVGELMECTLPSQASCSTGRAVEIAEVSVVLCRRGPAIGALEEAVDAADHDLASLPSERIHGCLQEKASMDAMFPPSPHLSRNRTGKPSVLRRQ